jgi:putative glycosyltransferase (TIGR04372 family)
MIFLKFKNSKEFEKIKTYPILIITLPVALIISFFIFVIRPFFHLKIGLLHSDRIGHFALNTELHLCEKTYFKKKSIELFYYPTKLCNSQLGKLIERKIIVVPKFIGRPFDLIFRKLDIFKAHRTRIDTGDYDVHNLIDKLPKQLTLSKEEIIKGKKILEKFGFKNKKMVLFIVRDEAYLANTKKSNIKRNFKYHNHRDDEVRNYESAMIYLAKKGYLVCRMGKKVKNKINIKHKNIIDYPFCKFKSDFMDVFLAHQCYFGVTNLTGYDALFVIFRRPMLCLGSLPIGCMYTSSKNYLNTLYHHYSSSLKRNLKLKEIFEMGLAFSFRKNEFDKKKVKIIKFKSHEIKEYTKDMLQFVLSKSLFRQNNLNKKLNLYYKELINKYDQNRSYHGKINSSFSIYFMKKNFKTILK